MAVGKGIASDYATRYGSPAASIAAGHPGAVLANLGRACVADPLLIGLDAAALAAPRGPPSEPGRSAVGQ